MARESNVKGFTIFEVILAILVLAMGLVTLFGLNSSIMSANLTNTNRYQATLYARSIMTALETKSIDFQATTINDTAYNILQTILGQTPPIEPELMEGYSAELRFQPWKIAGIDYDNLQLTELTVYWGPRKDQSVQVSLVMPKDAPE